jgi:hypothetical protein
MRAGAGRGPPFLDKFLFLSEPGTNSAALLLHADALSNTITRYA